MKKTIGILAITLVTASTAACGGGSGAGTASPSNAGPAAAPAAGTSDGMMDSPAPSAKGDAGMDAAPAGSDPAAGDMAGGAKTGMENQDQMAQEGMLPKGMTGAKAIAAGMGRDGHPVVNVKATDTTCVADKTKVAPGKVWFKVTNKGMMSNELYLEDAKAKELIQVEGVKTNGTGALLATLKKGTYMIACEPGGKGKQFRVKITVAPAM